MIDLYNKLAGIPERFLNKSFKNYQVFEENKKAFQLTKDFSTNYINSSNCNNGKGLFIYGKPRVGKTHLSAAIIHSVLSEIWKKNEMYFQSDEDHFERINAFYVEGKSYDIRRDPEGLLLKSIYFENCNDFVNTQKSLFRNKEQHLVRDRVQNADLLILDDIGSEDLTEWSLEQIFSIVFYRYEKCKQTIFTSNFDLSALAEKYNSKITDIEVERIITRILEMSEGIEIEGNGFGFKNED